jgi:NAD(P)-dependent dehydrogenase (short-subunit alcohol dehydrogenase family)
MGMTRIALVTGGSQGIGFEVAKQLGEVDGIRVILGVRDPVKGKVAVEKLNTFGIIASYIPLNIVDKNSIDSTREVIEKEYGKLDILVNNAGVSTSVAQNPSTLDVKLLREIFETNFFAQVAVTQAMLPLLRKSSAGRIVNVSSSLGSLSLQANSNYKYYPFNMFGYNSSKTALNAFTVSLAKELSGTSIKVNSADPDWCRTDLGGDQAPFSASEGAAVITRLALLSEDGPAGGFFNSSNHLGW